MHSGLVRAGDGHCVGLFPWKQDGSHHGGGVSCRRSSDLPGSESDWSGVSQAETSDRMVKGFSQFFYGRALPSMVAAYGIWRDVLCGVAISELCCSFGAISSHVVLPCAEWHPQCSAVTRLLFSAQPVRPRVEPSQLGLAGVGPVHS